ncbi:arginase family protein [Nocardia sp. CDC159]|uniref:Arginase family protein n=1 Tax=Nocardia pulmonis TaxID=2951408 RepID=A0A9X2IY81_9NOCA|nr:MULTISPECIES: arginase family protein [Nocardia]MCM6773636.1 arginase family protein [Nocardia pulmonis]MCM6786523.1 arginase family protein [Nocardia sp. CDC159]
MRILLPYHLDEYRPGLEFPVAADVVVDPDLSGDGDVWSRMAVLYEEIAEQVARAVRAGERASVLSGDCTTALGTVAGLQRAGMDPAVVWFDAHGDVQTLETSASGYLGGFSLRMLVGYGRRLLADRIGLRDIAQERVVLVDGRDLDPPEVEYLRTSSIRQCSVDELGELPKGPIYLHLDCDVIGDLPGLVFPAPDGPDESQVAAALRRVLDTGRVAAVGIACTWYDGSGAAERLRPLAESL